MKLFPLTINWIHTEVGHMAHMALLAGRSTVWVLVTFPVPVLAAPYTLKVRVLSAFAQLSPSN